MRLATIPLITFALSIAAAAARADELQLPAARYFHRGAVRDKSIVLFGGFPGETSAGNRRIDILNTSTGKWSLGREAPRHQGPFYGDRIEEKVYLLDGINKSLHMYDLIENKWAEGARIKTNCVNSTVVAFREKLYVIGGYSKEIPAEKSVQIYDPDTDRWANGPPLPEFKVHDHMHLAAVLDGKLHVVGGLTEDRGRPHWVLHDGRWEAKAKPPVNCLWKHNVMEAVDGRLYLMSFVGEDRGVYQYVPAADRWAKLGPMPDGMPIGLFASATIDKTIYVLGGVNSKSGLTADIHRYNTETAKWR